MIRTGELSKAKRAVVAALAVGGFALVLSACTLSATTHTFQSTGSGQTAGPITFTFTAETYVPPDPPFLGETLLGLHLALFLSVRTTTGTVQLTRTADRRISPTASGPVTVSTSCTLESTTSSTLECPSVVRTGGASTLTFAGLKIDATGASGTLEATMIVEAAEPPFGTLGRYPGDQFSTALGTFTTNTIATSPAAPIPPTFRSHAATTFTADKLSGYWVRLGSHAATLSLLGAPPWLSISPHAGYLRGTPPPSAAGHHYSFTILAQTDPHTTRKHGDNLTASQTFVLAVVGR